MHLVDLLPDAEDLLQKEKDELLAEPEALKASVIVDAHGPQVYRMIAKATVF